jgi:hypothetical protein
MKFFMVVGYKHPCKLPVYSLLYSVASSLQLCVYCEYDIKLLMSS